MKRAAYLVTCAGLTDCEDRGRGALQERPGR